MNTQSWKVLSWNVRGINSDKKLNSIRDRITDSFCDIICLQETKRAQFDATFIINFCPPSFDHFDYIPSVGASGGSIVIWKSCSFTGTRIFHNEYAASIEFHSLFNDASWILTNVYAPCIPVGKRDFIRWFKNIQMPPTMDWLIVGDFNLYRNLEDRNIPGADYAEMLLFNYAISFLGLVELPLKGRRFTWTNKQLSPLLERLDWFFTSPSWMMNYPNCCVTTLSMETSDHVPCLISINTSIPKGHLFRFENYWLTHEDFMAQVQGAWLSGSLHS